TSINKPKTGIWAGIKRLFSKKEEKIPTPAFDAGMKVGDRVISVNDKPVRYIDEFSAEISKSANKVVSIKVERKGQPLTLTPKVSADSTVGIYFSIDKLPEQHVDYGFFESFGIGTHKAWSTFRDNAVGIWKMITGKVSARNISSPIGISQVYGSTFEWEKFWSLTGLISIALAFMNLLPIPALDGGHVVFLIIEMIKGKPLNDKIMERAQIVGFVILLSLMVFAFGNDILKLLGK
ncbi:MAG: RIP metalloprotease RseP, partial [Pedobacter sp.]|nr:RIP metalloprotease RseP [Pedobacter sp.]